MTEQEAEVKRVINYIRSCRNAGIDTTITIDKSRNHLILNALEKIQKYRALGTVEELREAREKQMPKKPVVKQIKYSRESIAHRYICPVCNEYMISKDKTGWYSGMRNKYCFKCGQAIDWS